MKDSTIVHAFFGWTTPRISSARCPRSNGKAVDGLWSSFQQ
jgi:hypothetical protein